MAGKQPIDNTSLNEWGCIPVKLYVQNRQQVDVAESHGLLTSALEFKDTHSSYCSQFPQKKQNMEAERSENTRKT